MVTKSKKIDTVIESSVVVPAPKLEIASFTIAGAAPYVQHKFSAKVGNEILQGQIEGAKAKNKKKTTPRDIEAEYQAAMHKTADGRHGIPAPAFRSAMISACRLVGFQMVRAKISIFVQADGFDAEDGSPLVFIEGEPEMHKGHVRLESGVASIAIRPMWREWAANVRVRYDADQFGRTDVANLLMRAGLQVGVGEGRPDSRKSHGMGWGIFEIVNEQSGRLAA